MFLDTSPSFVIPVIPSRHRRYPSFVYRCLNAIFLVGYVIFASQRAIVIKRLHRAQLTQRSATKLDDNEV